MLTQIAYVRQQIIAAQRAGTPSARADHLQRALDGLERVEWQARQSADWVSKAFVDATEDDDDEPADPFLPWTVDEILAREG